MSAATFFSAWVFAQAVYALGDVNNGLAQRPPMGWNSYNHYGCSPNQALTHSNAKALVDFGLSKLGYQYVTVDCGWALAQRNQKGNLMWDTTLFPQGFPALGRYIHSLGLKFGVYSDSGIRMCSDGQDNIGSLYHEANDAATFAAWGADLLKYDNCYSDAALGYPNVVYNPATSPQPRFANMSAALNATNRPILFAICEWGVDFPSAWAPAIGNTWRITDDIYPGWPTIYRQLNQFVPQASFAGPNRWPDLDMLEVGNNVFTQAEEQTHFSLWAMCKSPLVIGAALNDTYTTISASSLAILSQTDVIAIDQDSLGVAANLTRRFTEAQYDVWAGPLSGNRTVVALINWADVPQTITLNLPDVGLQYAAGAKDIWNNVTVGAIKTSYGNQVPAHGTLLLILSGTEAAGHYDSALFATTTSTSVQFSQIYGFTSSHAYHVQVTLAKPVSKDTTIKVKTSAASSPSSFKIPANSAVGKVKLPLMGGNANTITFLSSPEIAYIDITNPAGHFHPPTAFTTQGGAQLETCPAGTCLPSGSKIGYLTPSSSASITIKHRVKPFSSTRYVQLYYANNDVDFAGSSNNARNITISVNGNAPTRLEVPLSGRSSELYSPGKGWYDSATLGILVDGFNTGKGQDTIVISNAQGNLGRQSYGADFMGITVF